MVELKNDLSICGTLHSVDQYLNIKLTDISVTDPEKYPHMVCRITIVECAIHRYLQFLQYVMLTHCALQHFFFVYLYPITELLVAK